MLMFPTLFLPFPESAPLVTKCGLWSPYFTKWLWLGHLLPSTEMSSTQPHRHSSLPITKKSNGESSSTVIPMMPNLSASSSPTSEEKNKTNNTSPRPRDSFLSALPHNTFPTNHRLAVGRGPSTRISWLHHRVFSARVSLSFLKIESMYLRGKTYHISWQPRYVPVPWVFYDVFHVFSPRIGTSWCRDIFQLWETHTYPILMTSWRRAWDPKELFGSGKADSDVYTSSNGGKSQLIITGMYVNLGEFGFSC